MVLSKIHLIVGQYPWPFSRIGCKTRISVLVTGKHLLQSAKANFMPDTIMMVGFEDKVGKLTSEYIDINQLIVVSAKKNYTIFRRAIKCRFHSPVHTNILNVSNREMLVGRVL